MRLVQISQTQWVDAHRVVSLYWDDAQCSAGVELDNGQRYGGARFDGIEDSEKAEVLRALSDLLQQSEQANAMLRMHNPGADLPRVMEAPEGATRIARVRSVMEAWRRSIEASADNGHRTVVRSLLRELDVALTEEERP